MVVLDECPEGGREHPDSRGDMYCNSVADALGEWQQDSLVGEAQGERPEHAGDLNELRAATGSLERRLAAIEARKYVDMQTLDQLVSRVHAGLEAQCAALYREQSEALAKQMAELLAEVQSLHWKALGGNDAGTQLSDSSTRLGEDSARWGREEKGLQEGGGGSSQRTESPRLDSAEASCRALPIATFAELASSASRLAAWNVLDPKELALRRLDERVNSLEMRIGQIVSTPTTWRGPEESRPAVAASLGRRSETPEGPMVSELLTSGRLGAGDFAATSSSSATGAGVDLQESSEHTRPPSARREVSPNVAQMLSSSSSSLTPMQKERVSMRLAHSASTGGLRRTLAAPPPRTEPELQVAPAAQTMSPQLRPVQLRSSGCSSPTAFMARGRAASAASLPGAGPQEIRGRVSGSHIQLGSSPGPARSVSPPWHDLSLNSSAHRSGTVVAASQRAPSASPTKAVVMPTTPQQFARRQSSSPSPMQLATSAARPGTTCVRSVPNLRA